MKRRDFLIGSASLGFASACTKPAQQAPAALSVSQKKHVWRLVMAVPKTLPIWGTGVVRFAKAVETMTEGRLQIKVYGAGELVPAFEVFDAVKDGKIQLGHAAAYYWQGKMPAAPFFTSVPFGLNANGMRAWIQAGGGQELWDELYAPHGVQSLMAGNTGFQMGGWYRKEINSPRDFRGLKMRIPGLGGKVIQKLGAKPQVVPGGEIFTNLSTGVIDATEWVGPYHDYTMGFYKVAPYYYYPGWHETGPVLELLINKQQWATIPAAYQEAIRQAATALDRDMYAQWLTKDAEFLAKIKNETDVQVRPFPAAVLQALREQAETVKQEVAATSPLAAKVVSSFSSFQRSFDAHQGVTEWAYTDAIREP